MSVQVATLNDVMAAICTQLDTELGTVFPTVPIQVVSELIYNPTPPSIDMWPADPFITQESFSSWSVLFIIRARVSTADQQGGQELLLDLMDPRGLASLRGALAADPTFDGVVSDSTVEEGPSGYIQYQSEGGQGAIPGSLVGCEWRLRVVL